MNTEQLLREIQECNNESICDSLCQQLSDMLEADQWPPHWISYPSGTKKYTKWRNEKYGKM